MAKTLDLCLKDGSLPSNIPQNIAINDKIFDAEDYHMFPQSENNICNNFDLNQTYFKLPECSIGNTTNELIENILCDNQIDVNNNLTLNNKTGTNDNLNHIVIIN